jgi:hypothetical protein
MCRYHKDWSSRNQIRKCTISTVESDSKAPKTSIWRYATQQKRLGYSKSSLINPGLILV